MTVMIERRNRNSFAQPWPPGQRKSRFIFHRLPCSWHSMYSDIIGNTQCDGLTDQTVPTKSGSRTYQQSTISPLRLTTLLPVAARNWCYEMRVVQAFSWMIFCLCSSRIPWPHSFSH